MTNYLLFEDRRIKCIYYIKTVTVLFEKIDGYKSINNKWVTIICCNESTKEILSTRLCFITLSNIIRTADDFSREFDILYYFYLKDDEVIKSLSFLSYGFNNFFNCGETSVSRCQLFKTSININKHTYKLLVSNNKIAGAGTDWLNKDRWMTVCQISRQEIPINDLIPIINYFRHLLQFVTFDTQTKIERVVIKNKNRESSDLIINHNFFEYYTGQPYSLSFSSFGNHKSGLFDFVGNYFEVTYPIFFNTHDLFHESQIPSIIGAFEGVFDECAKKDANIIKMIEMKKEEIKYNKIVILLKNFKTQNNISEGKFGNFISLISSFSLSLEEKIDYSLKNLMECINASPKDFGFVRTIVSFASYQNDARKMLVHAKRRSNEQINKAVYNIDLFQELIYYLVFKHIILCDDNEIRLLLDCYYFKTLNLEHFIEYEKNS